MKPQVFWVRRKSKTAEFILAEVRPRERRETVQTAKLSPDSRFEAKFREFERRVSRL